MSEHDHLRRTTSLPAPSVTPHGTSAGKRTLTQSLLPVQRSLRDEQRAVVDFDGAAGDDFYDQRATVEGRPTDIPLTDRQIRRARRKNPDWIRRLKVSALIFSNAEVDSSAFALELAAKQAAHGTLRVDGIAGPRTVAAVARQVSDARSGRAGGATHASGVAHHDPNTPRAVVDFDAAAGDSFYDSRATVEPHDDPFGLHLLGDRRG
ncbi:MAG: hypothetical protein HS111_06910 [Kofleriaceae bacterium]|nr:hypothetical protein [Kofleriaceae bacterium]